MINRPNHSMVFLSVSHNGVSYWPPLIKVLTTRYTYSSVVKNGCISHNFEKDSKNASAVNFRTSIVTCEVIEVPKRVHGSPCDIVQLTVVE